MTKCYGHISIHALLAESDGDPPDTLERHFLISIHALLAESDRSSPDGSLRVSNFNPRSPCGERQNIPFEAQNVLSISIHALLAESDPNLLHRSKIQNGFQSTLSLRRATTLSQGC